MRRLIKVLRALLPRRPAPADGIPHPERQVWRRSITNRFTNR